MSAPAWFDAKNYLSYKLDQLESVGNTRYDSLSLAKAFRDAGYTTDEDGLYKHFTEYGNAENVSPNNYFDADYYFQSKAAKYFGKDVSQVTTENVQFIKTAFAQAGLSAWDHYLQYGMAEGIDPNANFSTSEYFADKLALLQESDPSYTHDQMVAAFKSAGLTPVTHYFFYGKDEGIVPEAGSHGRALQQLTNDDDNLQGTVGDPTVDDNGDLTIDQNYADYFNGELGTLNSGDNIDGLGGLDTLYARVAPTSSEALEPTVNNVETILFRAESGSDANQGTSAKVGSYIDADRIYLEDGKPLTIGSDNSRLDLSIEDIRHNSSETIIRYADADPAANFWVYFDPQHLTPENAEETGTMSLKLIDVKNAQNHSQPLTEQPFNNFTFSYSGSDDLITFQFRSADASLYTGTSATYSTLLTAFQHALADYEAANPSMAGKFTVELGDQYPSRAIVGGDEYSSDMGTYVIIRSSDGSISAEEPGTGWGVDTGTVPARGGIIWGVEAVASTTCPLIETTIELDNVGRVQWDDASPDCLPDDIIYGSNAGDLQVGSMAMRGGIERMDVKVDQGSWLEGLYSTNDALRMVTVTGKDINGDDIIGNDANTAGQLYIGEWSVARDEYGNIIDGDRLDDNTNNAANTHYHNSNMVWTDPAKLLRTYSLDAEESEEGMDQDGLVDVAVFDATAYGTYGGELNIAASITDDSYDKYLKSVDGVRYIDKMFAPNGGYNGAFTYNLGSANDTLNMTVAGDIAADVDFKLNMNAGAGNDLVAFRYDSMSYNQSHNQKYLGNVTINAGDGDDHVWFYGDAGGSAKINGGSGADVIYANQYELFTGGAGSGVVDGGAAYNAVFVFNTEGDGRYIGLDSYWGATLNNNNASGLASFALNSVADATALYATVNFKGFSASYKISDYAVNSSGTITNGASVTAEDINHAIINAIDSSSTLSNLLVAKDGSGHSLMVESLINGDMTDDLNIGFQLRDSKGVVKASGDDVFSTASTKTGWYATHFGEKNFYTVDDATGDVAVTHTVYTGNDYTIGSQAIINAGAGNDLIVLGTNSDTDIISLSTNFGNDSIIDFEVGTDLINVRGLGLSGNAVNGCTADALVDKGVTILTGEDAEASSGIFTQAEVTKLASTSVNKIAFTADEEAGDTAVVLLQDVNHTNVYTAVLATKTADSTTTATATVMGSLKFEAGTTLNDDASDLLGGTALVGVSTLPVDDATVEA